MSKLSAVLLLIVATVFWGSTFSFTKYLTDYFHTFSLVFLRNAIASIILFVLFYKKIKISLPVFLSEQGRSIGKTIILLGIINFVAIMLLTEGLRDIAAANSGFITSLAVVFVPVIELVIRKKKQNKLVLLSILFVLGGVYIMSYGFGIPEKFVRGDVFTFISSILYSFFIILVDKLVKKNVHAGVMMFWNFFITSVLTLFLCLITRVDIWIIGELDMKTLVMFSYLAIFATTIPLVLMGIGQKVISPVQATLIYILEPIFAAIIAMIIISEQISINQYIGAGIILSTQFILFSKVLKTS